MSGGPEGPDLAAAFDEHLAELPDPGGLPVTGAEQADKLLDPSLPSTALIERRQPSAPPG